MNSTVGANARGVRLRKEPQLRRNIRPSMWFAWEGFAESGRIRPRSHFIGVAHGTKCVSPGRADRAGKPLRTEAKESEDTKEGRQEELHYWAILDSNQ